MDNRTNRSRLLSVCTTNKEQITTLLVFAFFIFTMVFKLTHSSLWYDEWVEYHVSQASILSGDLYNGIISTFQPPLYNFLMHFWLKVDDSILWFRLFNVFIGLLSGIFLYLTLKKICHWKVACIAVASLGASYQWVYCIQECSEYAIMLFFLFFAIYEYILCIDKFSFPKMWLFILTCIGAVYSQYGAGFVVVPLLVLFFYKTVLCKEYSSKTKRMVIVSYVVSFVFFALPLFFFFARQQIAHNAIGDNTVPISLDMLIRLPSAIGNIIGYFFNLHSENSRKILWGLFGILLSFFSLCILLKKNTEWVKKSIILVLWATYAIHFLLTELHIYAMIHPGQSLGFLSRYSYFYFPIFFVSVPVLFYEMNRQGGLMIRKSILMLCGAGCLCLFLSLYSLLGNWYKAKDNIYAKIWEENQGWKEPTYVLGSAKYAFDYYIPRFENETEEMYEQVVFTSDATVKDDLKQLPDRFWLWRSNYFGDTWQSIVEKANNEGYEVTVFDNSGLSGSLAFCTMKDKGISK